MCELRDALDRTPRQTRLYTVSVADCTCARAAKPYSETSIVFFYIYLYLIKIFTTDLEVMAKPCVSFCELKMG